MLSSSTARPRKYFYQYNNLYTTRAHAGARCCCLCAMGHAMSGLWHEPYARTDLVGYDRPQGPERQKRCISRFFLSTKLDVVCKCRADLILDGMYRVSLWRGATSGNEKRVVLTFLLKSTICIPGGRHGRSRAGGQRASLFCGEFCTREALLFMATSVTAPFPSFLVFSGLEWG